MFPLVSLDWMALSLIAQLGLLLPSLSWNDLHLILPAVGLLAPALGSVAALADEPRLPWNRLPE